MFDLCYHLCQMYIIISMFHLNTPILRSMITVMREEPNMKDIPPRFHLKKISRYLYEDADGNHYATSAVDKRWPAEKFGRSKLCPSDFPLATIYTPKEAVLEKE